MNARSRKDIYPLPLISETLERLGKAKLFTKLDVRNAFHRIRMNPGSKDITTFRIRFGQYKYQILPFGLTSEPSIFQRYINLILFPYLDEFYTVYVNNILIFLKIQLNIANTVGLTRDFQTVGYVHVGNEVFIRADAH
jgi:hypothetical protein